MAQTYTFGDALTVVKNAPGMPSKLIDTQAASLLDRANKMIWQAYEWKESLGNIYPFFLIGGQQDYGYPLVRIPADLQGLRKINLVQMTGGSASAYYVQEPSLTVNQHLEPTAQEGIPSDISYEKALSAYRFHMRPASSMSAPYWLVQGSYKKKPAKINLSDVSGTLLPYDDQYFDVFVACLKYVCLEEIRDKGAGEVQFVRGTPVAASGQLAVALRAIDTMADNEGMNEGLRFVHPMSGLSL